MRRGAAAAINGLTLCIEYTLHELRNCWCCCTKQLACSRTVGHLPMVECMALCMCCCRVRYTCLTFVDFLEALGRVADAKSLPTASDLDAAGYPSILEWALDKERLEGSGSSSNNNNGAAAASGVAPAAGSDNAAAAAGRRTSDTAAVQQQQPLAVVPANPGGNLPDIFPPRMSARFGAPKPRPLYAKLELLLDLIFRRLYWDPAQPESAFSYDVLLRMVKKMDKDMGP